MTDPDRFKYFRPDVPSPARIYDYVLGGKDHFPADREAAELALSLLPPGVGRAGARHNRAFLQRAVRYIVGETEVRQFLDIGAGMPTMGPTHEIAQQIDPESHVVYLDYDPIVIAHGREMLSGVPHTTIIGHDLRDPAEQIYADPEVREFIDPDRPVAVLLVAILPFVLDEEDPRGIVKRLMEPLPSGSHLVLSHSTADVYPEMDALARDAYRNAMSRAQQRSKAEVASLLDGLDLVDPGLVWVPLWRPDLEREYHPNPDFDIRPPDLRDTPEKSLLYGAVARKP